MVLINRYYICCMLYWTGLTNNIICLFSTSTDWYWGIQHDRYIYIYIYSVIQTKVRLKCEYNWYYFAHLILYKLILPT